MPRTSTTTAPALSYSTEAPRRGRKRKEETVQPASPPPLLDLGQERALTIEQTAQYLGVGRPKVYDYLRDGLPSVKLSDGVRRVMLSSLIAWLKERETRGVV
ncbi:helix-turn-helix domain-containing protein [Ktedonobacter racemifer]|uniref:DNA binding domain protein, excisionase family n=1 Tax=Ktedonobacter racemifer DSM 44963 TaxID=485913 RepID=D6TG99_KTERA|nr:helix-turn-helix domain-containing protein [Ktedonobacter racemifer]EFH88801.1 DNA binding domain protein, excisionase family [Ktedonobacter racemifer DSM 44963]